MLWQVIAGLLPTIGVSLLFWYVLRLILSADRRERLAMARFEAEQDRAAAAAGPSSTEAEPK